MNFKSFGDLARDIATNLWKVPRDIDLVIGIPRSGLMAASILALQLNKRFCDIRAFVENRPLATGHTRRPDGEFTHPHDARRVLVLDDSVDSGSSIAAARAELAPLAAGRELVFGAVYVHTHSAGHVELALERVEMPRVFAWNLFHRVELQNFCVDIDGVLCGDPSGAENDDGQRYAAFLANARPMARPSYPIGHLVSSRLERYRQHTVDWLDAHGIRFNHLHLLDLPSAAERRRQGCHARFKAEVYRSLEESTLFIESEPAQAAEIARLSGKPVLDYANQRIVPATWNGAYLSARGVSLRRRVVRRLQQALQ